MVSSKEYKIPQVRLAYVSDYSVEQAKVRQSTDIVDFIRSTYPEGEIEYRECSKVVYLNRAKKVLGFQTISEGSTSGVLADMKMIFAGAILSNAHAIILCHNHPSGNVNPSLQDDAITRKAKGAGELLDIPVIDHVIVTRNDYYSYNDNARL